MNRTALEEVFAGAKAVVVDMPSLAMRLASLPERVAHPAKNDRQRGTSSYDQLSRAMQQRNRDLVAALEGPFSS